MQRIASSIARLTRIRLFGAFIPSHSAGSANLLVSTSPHPPGLRPVGIPPSFSRAGSANLQGPTRCPRLELANLARAALHKLQESKECGRKLPNRLPNFCLICAGNCLIACLIACLIFLCNLGFFYIGDTLRDRPATPELGTCVPNGRRHGASRRPCKNRKSD